MSDNHDTEPTALAGIRVVDFSRFLPGSYVGWLMADMGADVIRIEHPREIAKQTFVAGATGESEAAFHRRRALQTQNRNKRSIMLNPGNPEARKAIHALIATADVLVEDYRPGTLANMGYGWPDMAKLNDRLVYTSVSFAGQTGPYSGRAGHDPAALALAGALSRLNGLPVPTMPGLQVADVLTGSHAAVATLMALMARERIGRGQRVDVAMSDASAPLMLVTMARNPDASALGPPDAKWHPKGGVWECGDGGYICTTDMESAYWRRFCNVVERPEYADLQHAVDRHPAMQEDLKAIFRTKPRDDWAAIFAAADTQAMPALTLAEALANEHNRARKAYVDVAHLGEQLVQVGTPFHLSHTPGRVRHAATLPGAHTHEVLASIGLAESDLAAIREAGGFDG